MAFQNRIRSATRASGLHFVGSVIVALLAAALMFGLWFPYPYRELSGGRELFFLVTAIDAVCGPLLTMVLYNPAKPRAELWRDLGLVMIIQLAALGYGLHVVWQARPLYLVQEVDRFKVVTALELPRESIANLPATLQPYWRGGPITVAIREPKDEEERRKVMFESVQGGRDYAERPEFYLPYEGPAALKSLHRAKPLGLFLEKYPSKSVAAVGLAISGGLDMAQLVYLPVVGREDWIAVLDPQARILGFLEGDGF